ncbi:MAG: hypothetical protein M3437_07675 [Chloroflexota bacterium]|nr:hypothetical protein [Chloroflexota bacterium]MDQ5867457.1 hypothetical protein [Chloroflexota bacterium]
MERAKILAVIVMRHTFGVCMTGALLGAIYGLLLALFYTITRTTSADSSSGWESLKNLLLGLFLLGTVAGGFGAVFGAVLGIAVGFVNGLLLGGLTILAYYPPREYKYYPLVTGSISAAVAVATTSLLGFIAVPTSSLSSGEDASSFIAFLLSPAPVSGLGAWWASRYVSNWYQHRLPPQKAEATSPSSPTLL